MRANLTRYFKVLAGILLIGWAFSDSSHAADLGIVPRGPMLGGCSDIRLVCENGRTVPVCPIALGIGGEIVTATLHFHPGGATHVRLVPMGVGYRYAGRGVWVDGLHSEALLNWGPHRTIACSVEGAL